MTIQELGRVTDPTFKIKRVEAACFRYPLTTPVVTSFGRMLDRPAVFVRVEGDDGLVGWGEALCVGMQPPDIVAAAIRSVFAPMLIGCDPREPEVLWHRMYNRTRDYGRKGAVISGLSGIDIALWDIKARRYGVPLDTPPMLFAVQATRGPLPAYR